MRRINAAFHYIEGQGGTLFKLYILIAGLLVSALLLTACHKKDSPTAEQVQQENASLTQTLTGTSEADTGDKPKNTEEDTDTGQGAVNVPTRLSSVTLIPMVTSEPKVTLVPEDEDSVETEGDQVEVIGDDINREFYYEELPEDVIDRIQGKSYKENCDVPYSELRYVRVLYWGFDEKAHKGELIVNKAIAEDIVEIFRELYDKQYPIERMVLVDEYEADDNTSMAADNTSCFNYRNVDGTNHLSLHSYGLAIDINPKYNPYVRTIDGKKVVTPDNGMEYADRSLDCQYYINTEDACYKAFISRGFTWGGEWVNSKDYQHFQKKLEE